MTYGLLDIATPQQCRAVGLPDLGKPRYSPGLTDFNNVSMVPKGIMNNASFTKMYTRPHRLK